MPPRRAWEIAFHWSVVLLILLMVRGGAANPAVPAVFVAIVTLWVAMTLRLGLMGRPGPKLSPRLRRVYP